MRPQHGTDDHRNDDAWIAALAMSSSLMGGGIRGSGTCPIWRSAQLHERSHAGPAERKRGDGAISVLGRRGGALVRIHTDGEAQAFSRLYLRAQPETAVHD